ncbi:sulfite oxidase isoform X2 [Bicyclus anynana]|uniref:sulfite oxidase n=1 Tax=Bicyclus anynana TaxID=110368 RepID=A0ABM3M7P9_BICAN|nr:sulfite oxidase isoform X2 [Bicyclus anynana]
MSLKAVLLKNLLRQSRLSSYTPIVINYHRDYRYNNTGKEKKHNRNAIYALLGSVIVGSAANIKQKESKNREKVEAGAKKQGLPTYTAEEVSKHDNKKSFWVTYKYGVYDVTSFLPSHPGGEQIYNAAGLSIEPFWNVYGMHKTEEVYKLLESYRIGNLHDDDVVDHSDDELWAREPHRDPRLLVMTAKPFNAEIPPHLQVQNFDTPNELFYVRQHMPVPELDAKEHRLRVVLVGDTTTVKEFSLEELQQFPAARLSAALMCAGNRRSEMNKFTGSDIDATGVNFSTSIPLYMALDPNAQILLATSMNGAPLPPDHGYPLRVVVPGAPAVRSVKWLQSITISNEESGSHWHQKDYRSFNPTKTWETADFPSAPPVYSLPVTAAACEPADGATVAPVDGHIQVKGTSDTLLPSAPPVYSLPVTAAACEPADGATVAPVDGHIQVKGYAYSGGGAKILRVDVSSDRGRTWREAQLQCDAAPPRTHYAWTLWTISMPVDGACQMEIWVKATDSNFNTQPENFDDIWNIRGILSNAYHRIKVNIKR